MRRLKDDRSLLSQLAAIAAYFELGSVLSQQRVGGYANENYLVTTEAGVFVFKLLLNHPLEDFQQELIYLQRLEKYAYPAAYYLPSPHIIPFYQDGNVIAVVMQKKEGHAPEKSMAVSREIGSRLAQLHLIPNASLPGKGSWMNANYILEALDIAQHTGNKIETDRFLQAYQQVCSFQPGVLPQSIIHGDVTPDNCLFIDDQLSALLDWEEVTIGASLLDFAMATLMFCFVRRVFQPPLLISLLDGYTQRRPLMKEELGQLEVAVKHAGLMISTYFLLQSLQDPSVESAKDLQGFYWQCGLDSWSTS